MEEAWVAKDSSTAELRHIQVGDELPGIGRVKSIQQVGDSWTVQGSPEPSAVCETLGAGCHDDRRLGQRGLLRRFGHGSRCRFVLRLGQSRRDHAINLDEFRDKRR